MAASRTMYMRIPADTQKYPSGRRGSPAKGVDGEIRARVRIPPSAPSRSKLCIACSDLFYKSERAHAAAPPFQIATAALGCDLVPPLRGVFLILQKDRFSPSFALRPGGAGFASFHHLTAEVNSAYDNSSLRSALTRGRRKAASIVFCYYQANPRWPWGRRGFFMSAFKRFPFYFPLTV